MKLAVKIIDKKKLKVQSEIDHIVNQVKLLKKLNNPRIMKLFNVLETSKYIFIFMELIEGGNLKDLIINRYSDSSTPFLFRDCECSIIMKGILESLNYLHKNYIIHRDIKPENILFKKKNDLSSVVLCDFGLAYQLKEYDNYITEICGTTIYMAPEIFSRRGYDYLVDSFSAGIVLFELCSGGMHPFFVNGMKKNEYIEKILNFNEKVIFSKEMPLLARNLFLKLCKYEPILRYGPYRALRHPWITRSNTSQIPMTLLEEYNKSDKIINFKALLATGIALVLIKNKLNLKPKIQEFDSCFNEHIFNKSNMKKKINHKINFNINLGNNFLKTSDKFNYNFINGISHNFKQAIPFLRTFRESKKLDKIIEKKLSKKGIFPKIGTKHIENLRYKSKEENDSKVDYKINIDKNKGMNLYFSKDKNHNRNRTNRYLFLRTYSCDKNSNKKESKNNSKNFNDSIPKSKINKNVRISDKIFKNYGTLNSYKSNDKEIVLIKHTSTNLISGNKDNKNKVPNLLSLSHKHRSVSNVSNSNINNNINLYIPKNIKNVRLISHNHQNNSKRFFLKDVLTNI